ncbi:hypothetical protein [Amycolatopsis sp. GM8]|uniref:hypothetical protein n=1 Tax=Amycolatopsis sp. GM8 TaxID=2896530 RepID=UPI001F250F0C|nr:hypothetical protein [Amycolatopsis sp. GM8]
MPAPAEPPLVVSPGDSADAATMRLQTNAGCPGDADAYNAVLHGKGLPGQGVVITATTSAGMSHTQGFTVFPAETLHDFAADNNVTLSGDYQVSVYCVDSFSQQAKSEFTATIRVDTPGRYTAVGAAKGPNTLAPREELETAPASPPPSAAAAPPPAGQTVPQSVAATPAAAAGPAASGGSWAQPTVFIVALVLAVGAVVLVTALVRRHRAR